ncbi:hypothetical protein [Streptomyces tateyamensis]|uniref:hypothetical protein n=1 Tax=Streptomyces tateyamensis TaxID=565073 RepID=UPI0011B63B61|nr:hypothetical protein [Streptomyces tateyamensis]
MAMELTPSSTSLPAPTTGESRQGALLVGLLEHAGLPQALLVLLADGSRVVTQPLEETAARRLLAVVSHRLRAAHGQHRSLVRWLDPPTPVHVELAAVPGCLPVVRSIRRAAFAGLGR